MIYYMKDFQIFSYSNFIERKYLYYNSAKYSDIVLASSEYMKKFLRYFNFLRKKIS